MGILKISQKEIMPKLVLRHGYLVEGSTEKISPLLAFLERAGIETKANPDVYVREYLSFGIDDARALRERANTRAIAGERRVFIVIAPSMTSDAQNALLKTLEEPPADAVFFFVVTSPLALLPTLRSRTHVLELDSGAQESAIEMKKFLAASPEMRLEMIKPLYTRDDADDERDVRSAVSFLSELERVLAKHAQERNAREGIHAIYLARKHLMDKGSLLKPLLEQVALLVPRV